MLCAYLDTFAKIRNKMQTPIWMGAILILALIDWTVTAKHWVHARYATKPAVLLALLLWFWWASAAPARSPAAIWFAAGLFFSLLGDIFLMIPRSWFLAGLGSFLLAHLAYITSLNQTSLPMNLPFLILCLLVCAWSALYYRVIRAGLARTPGSRRLRTGVLLYSLVITLMLLSALSTLFRPAWLTLNQGVGASAILVSLGGVLFFTSDSILAYDRFIRPLRLGRLLIRITYHTGQTALAAGMLLHLLNPA
jgi:uncharacterized membrane protein YhhN